MLWFLELEPDEDAEVDVVVLWRDVVLDDDDVVVVSEADGWAGVRMGVCAGVRLAADSCRRGGKDGGDWRAEREREPEGTRPGHWVSSVLAFANASSWASVWDGYWGWMGCAWAWAWAWACARRMGI